MTVRKKKVRSEAAVEQFAEQYDGHVACPWCKATDTRVVSPFGGTVSEILFECRACKQNFGWMKWEHRKPDQPL